MYARNDPRNRGVLYKIAILGDGGVGKTALTIQLCLNQFVETYDPTIEDSYRKKMLLDGEPVTLEILDTAGQEEYTALRDQWIREGEGFLLVYSITSRHTFNRIRQYYEQIMRVKDGEDFSAILVANKCDRNDERVVSVNEGKQLAKELDMGFFETSAKMNINTEAAFISCARNTRDLREQVAEESSNTQGEPVESQAQPKPSKSNTVSVKDNSNSVATGTKKVSSEKPKKKKCLIM